MNDPKDMSHGFFWADEEPQEDSVSDSDNDQPPSPSHAAANTSFFAQDPDTDNESALHSFYQEESTYQPSFSLSTAPIFSQLSQSANMSLAELSRMDESTQESMMSQSSHRDAEVDRQRKKMERKRKRGDGVSVLKKRRKRYNYSERQIQRGAIYRRFRYEKSIDVSHEQDVGGSVEYLVRQKLNDPDEQSRLIKIAQQREALRMKQEKNQENDATVDKSNESIAAVAEVGEKHTASTTKVEPNWDFLDEGYVTMPRTQAKGLSYYIYNISNQKLGQSDIPESSEGEKDLELVNNTHSEKRCATKDETETASVVYTRTRRVKRKEIKWETISFPLQYNQLNPKLDLRSFTPMTSTGQDGLVLLHGRLARSVCARLVAGGGNFHDYSNNTSGDAKAPIKHEDQASDVSHSSDSSESFGAADLYGGQFQSQGTFGSTTIIGMDDCNPNGLKNSSNNQNRMMRLLTLVHTLPNYTHRNRFYIKIATELGTLRQYWENEFKSFFESNNFDESNQMAVKSFFGVDGNINPGPFWCSDPAMATDINRMYKWMQRSRIKLISRLRSFMKQATGRRSIADIAGHQTVKVLQEQMNEIDDVQMEDVGTPDEMIKEEQHSGVDSECVKLQADESQEDVLDFQAEPKANTESVNDSMSELPASLLDAIELNKTQGDIDKYSKVVHEANFDLTNVTMSLSSFLNELTAGKAQLNHLEQVGSLAPLDQSKKWSAKNNIDIWNENIDKYLTVAENQTRPLDMNLNKRNGNTFQCASLAQSVIARQSYVSNGGGVGYKSKMSKHNQTAARLSNIKEEDDSDNDQDEYDHTVDTCQEELLEIKRSGGDLLKRGREHLTNENLQLFAPIHLTTGLTMLTEHMTPESTEIMSRQCSPDNLQERTPFDLVWKALQHLEDRGELISSPANARSRWEAKGKVVDEVLVSSWETAAAIFKRCVKEEPHDVDNWSWYVATLLGIVCISSGVSVSSDARDNDASVESEDSFDDTKSTRYQLDHYDGMRSHAARVIRDLINLADKIDCPMFHLAVSSMLEWKQAVRLMDGPFSQCQDILALSDSELKRLYAHHVSLNSITC
jgi:hypothetical protein